MYPIYLDTNLEGGNNLSFFGQDAYQSGYVAAKLMCLTLGCESKILIVKLASKKAISTHINLREDGFKNYFNDHFKREVEFLTTEVDLSQLNEPRNSLDNIFRQHTDIKGVFVPNSRVFKVADYLNKFNKSDLKLIGFDLVEEK